uniref:Uncharacterized protein n=1 Tax=Candidatus Kentrum sp. DK TaxID=2126562 RepID=A0A450TC71_9GAMM|nr:MAG: hypothetical protein BECKDK2373C_GA0170839_11189 [Candidatus Kentron sp. DK]
MMDAGLVISLSGLALGLIAGSIGALSAVLSYRMAQKHAEREAIENDKARRHQEMQIAIPKRLEAAETVWRILFKIEHGEDINPKHIE